MGQNSSTKAAPNHLDCTEGTQELSTAPPLPLGQKTRFEGKRGPFAIKTGKISDELLELILGDESGCCLLSGREELLQGNGGFIEANDYPVDVPGFKRYKVEGFQHGLATHGEVEGLQVRGGFTTKIQPANQLLRSFVRAVIEKNKKLLDHITDALPEDCSMLRELFSTRRCLSDLAVQISHGDAQGHPNIPLHLDNVNSLLHMAISLKGSRTLLIGYPDDRHSVQFSLDQSAGCVYLTTPWAFRHGVNWPAQAWEDRAIAVQCRTLMTVEENKQVFSQISGREEELASCVADVLEQHNLLIPTVKEVMTMSESLLREEKL